MTWVLYLLILQAALGGFDVAWNHEIRERLPQRSFAALEQKIHAARELLYALIFFALACAEWRGWWIAPVILLLVIELLLTIWDFIIEDRTRVLSAVERTTHLLLSVNGGAYLALLVPQLAHWAQLPDEIAPIDYGFLTTLLCAFAFGVLIWGVRDLLAGLRLSEKPTADSISLGSQS